MFVGGWSGTPTWTGSGSFANLDPMFQLRFEDNSMVMVSVHAAGSHDRFTADQG
jgi:hypothetical protein